MEGARRATAADVATLVALIDAEHRELGAQRGGDLWVAHAAPAATARVTQLLDRVDAVVLAGVLDDVVLGVAIAQLVDAPGLGSVATIVDLYVEPDAREVGIGAALLEAVRHWALETGCVGIDAAVLPGSRAAKNFFEAHGLVARAITVHHRFRRGAEEQP